MIYYLKLYLAALVAFLAIDFVWLGLVARQFYQKHLGFLLADQPNWWAAIVFYLVFVVGIVLFCIDPALQAGSIWKAVTLGAFFGFVTYGTYDLTNYATLKDWPAVVTIVDLCWGAALSSSVSCLGYLAGRWFETG